MSLKIVKFKALLCSAFLENDVREIIVFYVLRVNQNKARLRLSQIEPFYIKGYTDCLGRKVMSDNACLKDRRLAGREFH